MNLALIPCPFCKTPIPDDSVYCDTCGEKLRKCTSCGAFVKSKRCTKCGNQTEEILPKAIPNITANNIQDKSSPADRIANKDLIPGHIVCLSTDLRIGFGHEAIIGRRGSYGNVFQNFQSISGLHAKLIQVADAWMIEDIGSSYGTFINGKELEKNIPTPINVGDIVKLANIEFKVTE